MSRILALDTSSDACSVALLTDNSVDERFSQVPREHTKRLLPMVDEILADHQLTLSQIDAIAFGRGPGSFTGLRICLGVVQGLAFGADLPVIPVSTLQAMAVGAQLQHGFSTQDRILVALDARMNEVYWCEYEVLPMNETAQLKPITDEFVMAPEAVAENISALPAGAKRHAIGPGWHYPELAEIETASQDLEACPHAADIVRLAQPLLAAGEVVSALDAQPVYLRDTVAWKKRQRFRQS
ncbi:tRNA (adenosine(37)-N6)-threonylcarbamoyltransferase complex dimerization subunit type 1 TsaB [Maricurvus nonylphenolicus]|uniref:tRNA (adenosine(37)-N6)-threonylcarbamoyltransferase complex dimerization subunit type 1 TsaB n=1 Tax=Maricurvus nonylphenolicus TaxID=1008307 RepID=UPI0036F338B6